MTNATDAYEPGRLLYTLTREVDVENFSWKSDESGPTQTLDSIFLKPESSLTVNRSQIWALTLHLSVKSWVCC